MKNIFKFLALLGIIKAGESAISAWSKPIITSEEGNGTLDEKINDGVTTGTATGINITATSNDTIVSYTKESQTPESPVLAIDNNGVVTVTSGTVSYSSATSFELVVSVNDSTAIATATVTLLVNAAPSFQSYSSSPCIEDGAAEGTDLIDLTATDANNGDSITYDIAAGNNNTDFLITSTGVVEVATGKTLDRANTSTYTLEITATDNSSTPLVATATVTATVLTTCSTDSGTAALSVTLMTVLSALIILIISLQ